MPRTFPRCLATRLLLVCLLPLSACGLLPTGDAPGRDPASEVSAILIGEFNSADQAQADEAYYPIALRHVAIWEDRTDGPWLYVEQALQQKPEAPYRQRIYHLVNTTSGASVTVRSDIYALPGDPLVYAGAKAARFDQLTPEELLPRTGCSVHLTRITADRYAGSTEGNGCTSSLRGAAYATSEMSLESALLATWDRGYDAQGEQVWGAVNGPYLFRRQ